MLQKSLKIISVTNLKFVSVWTVEVQNVDSEMVNSARTAPTNLPFTFFLLLLDASRYLAKMITFTVYLFMLQNQQILEMKTNLFRLSANLATLEAGRSERSLGSAGCRARRSTFVAPLISFLSESL